MPGLKQGAKSGWRTGTGLATADRTPRDPWAAASPAQRTRACSPHLLDGAPEGHQDQTAKTLKSLSGPAAISSFPASIFGLRCRNSDPLHLVSSGQRQGGLVPKRRQGEKPLGRSSRGKGMTRRHSTTHCGKTSPPRKRFLATHPQLHCQLRRGRHGRALDHTRPGLGEKPASGTGPNRIELPVSHPACGTCC